ncbi:MAG: hypothetical protein MUC59_19510 [Saprospiraceae bacterium]|nr:hypothetical protein [Saprospiraceae bacterium]
MKVNVKDTLSGNLVAAEIKAARLGDMPLKKDGWSFNWRQLHKDFKAALFFKLTLEATPHKVEGMLMLTLQFDRMVFMNDLEVAPHNLGTSKRYDWVAGCLIAYACFESQCKGKGDYIGFVAFESKTKLIELYINKNKYGAMQLAGHRI